MKLGIFRLFWFCCQDCADGASVLRMPDSLTNTLS